MTESQALLRCQIGDSQAFRHLAGPCQDALYRTAILITGSPSLAEAQVREAMNAAWRGQQPGGLGARAKPWLLRSLIRQERALTAGSSSPSDHSQHPAPVRIPPPPRMPGDRDVKRQQIRRALVALDPAHRHLLILRYFANLNVPQLSAVFEEPEDDIESRRREALGQLRCRLIAIGADADVSPDSIATDQALVDALRDYFSAVTAALRVPGDLWDALESRAPGPSFVTRIRRKVLTATSRLWTPLAATGAAAALASAVICAYTA